MSKVRNSDIRSELRPSAQLLKLTYTAASETAFEKFDRQCIKNRTQAFCTAVEAHLYGRERDGF